jgi:hypothetical protein
MQNHRWLIDEIVKVRIAATPAHGSWLLDSLRKKRQAFRFKDTYGKLAFHVHLNAHETILKQRYDSRLASGGEYAGNTPYSVAKGHSNEVEVRSLIEVADVILDVSNKPPEKVAAEILELWNTRGKYASGSSD